MNLLNPWVILGILLALAAAAAGGFAGGDHYRGLNDAVAFQKERDGWTNEKTKIKEAGDHALRDAEGERATLQGYISDVLGPKYAALDAQNRKFQGQQKAKGDAHAKLELPADDRACDLPAGMFDDWITNNHGPGGSEGGTGLSGVGLDTTLRPAPRSLGAVTGGAGGEPSPGH